MLNDLVVDANVLAHAANPAEPRFGAAIHLAHEILNSDVIICVDENFSLDSAKNRSRIGHEYLEFLQFGSLGFMVIATLAEVMRIKEVPRGVNQRVRQFVNQNVRDPTDHVYIYVAHNSDDQTLVSHDFRHLPPHVRNLLSREIEVNIVDSEICVDLLVN